MLAKQTNNENVYVKSYGGAKVNDMKYHTVPSMEYNPSHVILHVGTNEIGTKKTARKIAQDIIDVCDLMKTQENAISVSGLLYRRNENENTKVDEVNDFLRSLCEENGYYFLDNSNIPPRFLRDFVHVAKPGNDVLFNNFLQCINN